MFYSVNFSFNFRIGWFLSSLWSSFSFWSQSLSIWSVAFVHPFAESLATWAMRVGIDSDECADVTARKGHQTEGLKSTTLTAYSFTAAKSTFLRLPSSSFSVNPTYYHKISLECIHLFVWKFLLVISVCLPHYHQISFSSHPTKCHNSTLQLMANAFSLDKPMLTCIFCPVLLR